MTQQIIYTEQVQDTANGTPLPRMLGVSNSGSLVLPVSNINFQTTSTVQVATTANGNSSVNVSFTVDTSNTATAEIIGVAATGISLSNIVSLINVGLQINLAANTTYSWISHVDMAAFQTNSGLNFEWQYSGTVLIDSSRQWWSASTMWVANGSSFIMRDGGVGGTAMATGPLSSPGTHLDFIDWIGMIRTNSSGILYLQASQEVPVLNTCSVFQGSYIRALRIG